MLQDQRKVKSKWDPLNYGLWLVERQEARTKLFVLRNISTGKYLERHVPAHHLSLVKDTNVPITTGDGKPLPKLISTKAILKILGDRPAQDGTTEYKVRWKARNKPDSWMPSSAFQIKSKSEHHRNPAPSKKCWPQATARVTTTTSCSLGRGRRRCPALLAVCNNCNDMRLQSIVIPLAVHI